MPGESERKPHVPLRELLEEMDAENRAEFVNVPHIEILKETEINGRLIRYCVVECGSAKIEFEIVGDNPVAFIVSDQHGGSEPWVSAPLNDLLDDLIADGRLPDCIIVRCASPSSVKRGTRENYAGHDVNRGFNAELGFYKDGEIEGDDEVVAMAYLVKKMIEIFGQLDFFLSFHGDPIIDKGYLYHHAKGLPFPALGHLRADVKRMLPAMGLYTGPDEEDEMVDDLAVGHFVTEGYTSVPNDRGFDGTLEQWVELLNFFKKLVLVFEAPNISYTQVYVWFYICLKRTLLDLVERRSVYRFDPTELT